MADTAFQTQYRNELINGFERRESLLRKTCTTEGIITGNAIVFDVVDSGGATAQTRGVNGLISARADNNTQYTCTLTEWHDLVRKTRWNIFASQGDQRAVMQDTSMAVLNRKMDDQIITELATATQYAGLTAGPLTMDLALRAIGVVLGGNVPLDGNVHGVISVAGFLYLMQIKEVTSKDYVGEVDRLTSLPREFYWAGLRWIVHNALPGVGTTSEKLFVYHKAAIGHGMDKAGLQSPVGYDEEQDYSWARCSGFMGAKVLQNSGICVIRHDGSGFAATA